MISYKCDICHKEVRPDNQQSMVHFCQRCQPFAEEFVRGLANIVVEYQGKLRKATEGYRGRFLNERVLKSDESQGSSG